MNGTLSRALLVSVPVAMLLAGSIAAVRRRRSASALLALLGAALLTVMVLTHLCEAWRLFPGMGWGREHTAGHYLDQGSAVVGLTLLLTGCAIHAIRDPR